MQSSLQITEQNYIFYKHCNIPKKTKIELVQAAAYNLSYAENIRIHEEGE
jgi:hypothetical protein